MYLGKQGTCQYGTESQENDKQKILEIVILGRGNYFSFLSPHSYPRLHLEIVDTKIFTYHHLVSRDQERRGTRWGPEAVADLLPLPPVRTARPR